MCLAICVTCACHLVIFGVESLFVDAVSVSQTAVFHLIIVWYCDATTITLIGFLKVDQVSESSECKAKREHISLGLYSFLVYLGSALLNFAQVAYEEHC